MKEPATDADHCLHREVKIKAEEHAVDKNTCEMLFQLVVSIVAWTDVH